MSKESTPELVKSWVIVDPDRPADEAETKATSGVQEVTENEPHLDSDTDSISVISESGCSYKTDEEEFQLPEVPVEPEETVEEKPELPEKPEIVEDEPEAEKPTETRLEPQIENKNVEKLLYFATSAACAIILIGFSVAVQHYFQGASDVDNFDSNNQFVFSHVQKLKNDDSPKKFSLKRKNQLKLDEIENKIAKMQENKEFQEKIVSPMGDNDLKIEGNLKSNYKLNKNKIAAKCNKENCDVNKDLDEKIELAGPDKINEEDQAFTKKQKELKIKEDYLKEKEKFLIEKEHDLLKKEIKLNKEKEEYTKKHDKKSSHQKEKENKEHLKDDDDKKDKYKAKKKEYKESDDSHERKDKYKTKEYQKQKNNKKYKQKEDKYFSQKRFKFSNDGEKKRNVSGQWYLNLHEARDNMRQRKRAGLKRNKAHWYFQWMVDRARLRVK